MDLDAFLVMDGMADSVALFDDEVLEEEVCDGKLLRVLVLVTVDERLTLTELVGVVETVEVFVTLVELELVTDPLVDLLLLGEAEDVLLAELDAVIVAVPLLVREMEGDAELVALVVLVFVTVPLALTLRDILLDLVLVAVAETV